MKNKLEQNKIIVIVLILSFILIGLLFYFANNQKISNKELYENAKNLNNFSTNLKVYIGADNEEEASTVLKQESIIEDLEQGIYEFNEIRKISYGSTSYVNDFSYKGEEEKQYFKISESNTKLIIPLGEWIETPNEEYKEINQANMDALRQSFTKKTMPKFVYDLEKLDKLSSRKNTITFDISKDKEFQEYIKNTYATVDCYSDGQSTLEVEIDGVNISKYTIRNGCTLIEYEIYNLGKSKFERLGK